MKLKKIFGVLLGPILYSLINWVIPIEGLSVEGKNVLASLIWMAVWWMLEVVPSGITGLLPLVLLPLLGSMSAKDAASTFANNTVFLLMGGFAIGVAIQKWELHRIIAINIIRIIGASTSKLFLGLLLSSTFISMWVSNVATAVMVLPIASAISITMIDLLKSQQIGNQDTYNKFEKSLMVAVVFGAIIGGSITLIGTPTNTQLAGFYSELFNKDLPFAQFILFEFPIAIVQLIAIYLITTKLYYKIDVNEIEGGLEYIKSEKERIGKVSFEQKAVVTIFILTIFFWVTRTFIWTDIIPGINDGMIAVVAMILLYLIPSRDKKSKNLLTKADTSKISWDVLLMIGGGMSLAAAFSGTDLAKWIGDQLFVFQNSSLFIVLGVVVLLSIFVTQMAPNTATGAILIPIAATLANSTSIDPLTLMAVASLGSGFAFTFPSGTPAMGVLYSTEKFTMKELLKLGMPMVVITIILVLLVSYFWLPIIF